MTRPHHPGTARDAILIVDFGAQYCQLIARRVRELGVLSKITVPHKAVEAFQELEPRGVILSGGPSSVYETSAPRLDPAILHQHVPVLGICYGLHWMAQQLGGDVRSARSPTAAGGEYGHQRVRVKHPGRLLAGVAAESTVWMSHGDRVEALPKGFEVLASSEPCPIAAFADENRGYYAVQFHPEVHHTAEGQRILRNFVHTICACAGDWKPASILEESVHQVRELVGPDGQVLMGLSGGVDSSVAATLIHRAVGDRLHCVFVDNGLLRHGERDTVEATFRGRFHVDLHVADAGDRFLAALSGVTDPETKRKRIGHVFVDVFKERARAVQKSQKARWFLGQGTLYPDVIESVAAHGGPTATIKTHHNVGGLPKDLGMELVEPLRELFKDEVRAVGRALGLPDAMVDRQPFPGPGLGVRCLGEVTRERLQLLRAADHIVTGEIEAAQAHKGLWQYFAVLLPVSTVGVMGDARTYESACVVRVVESQDGMTADWGYLSRDLLRRISNRIINEVRGINRVVLDISSKPPATIEWE
jgi:GMP synthase (glutamine-hydrolysing)